MRDKLRVLLCIVLLGLCAGVIVCVASDKARRVAARLPVTAATLLYTNPEPIEISGYAEDAMEPCISLDGQYLFFNNSNEQNVKTHIHFAKRMAPTKFQYLGILPGT